MIHSSADLEIEAWVETLDKKKRFAEYREVSKPDSKTGKEDFHHESYLECEEGESFRIKFRCRRQKKLRGAMSVRTEIDGRKINSGVWKASSGKAIIDCMFVLDEGEQKEADLTFASLPKTDEEDKVDIRGLAIEQLGKIKVVLRRGEFKPSTSTSRRLTEPVVGTVHEKQLKLGSTVQASNLRKRDSSKLLHFTAAAHNPEVCTFVWNYHTKAKLTIMGIIEEEAPAPISRPAEANPAPTPSGSKSASPAATAVKAELNVEVDEEVQVVPKREREIEEDGGVEIVKKMRKDKRGPGSSFKPIIVTDGKFGAVGIVDLTDD